MMRFVSLFSLLLIACNNSTNPSGQYDSMLFKRDGGGNLVFSVSRGTSSTTYHVFVSRISYHDTSISVVLAKSVDNAAAFDSLSSTLNGEIGITGTFKQDSTIVGTWASVYVIKDAAGTEVTNVALRNTLLKFEDYVNALL